MGLFDNLGESLSGLTNNLFGEGSAKGGPPPPEPGRGVIDIKFDTLKDGGFKVWLFFWLLAESKHKDNEKDFTVRQTEEGIRVYIIDDPDAKEYEGVLDMSWGSEPEPFFRVDRFHLDRAEPYDGELYILNNLLDVLLEMHWDKKVEPEKKLFLLPGDKQDLSRAKSKLAQLSSMH